MFFAPNTYDSSNRKYILINLMGVLCSLGSRIEENEELHMTLNFRNGSVRGLKQLITSGFRLILFVDYLPYQSERRHWKREARTNTETVLKVLQNQGIKYHSIYQKLGSAAAEYSVIDPVLTDYEFKPEDLA